MHGGYREVAAAADPSHTWLEATAAALFRPSPSTRDFEMIFDTAMKHQCGDSNRNADGRRAS
jgi:hypothetical protein